LLSPTPPGTFSVLAPCVLHPGLRVETFSSDAFIDDPVQVGDALLTLFVGWRDFDSDYLRSLRFEQVDQIQRRRRVSRGFFDHHLVGDQLKFMIKGGMPGVRFGCSRFVTLTPIIV